MDNEPTKIMNQRTPKQNNSLHKWCSEMARELNDAGILMEAFVKDIQADHTMESVKSLWRAFARAKYEKKSTTELTRVEINEIYEEVNRHTSQWGIHLPFPSYQETDNYLKSYE